MAHDHDTKPTPGCPACEFEPFIHNHFFNGKLLVADDFVAETAYHAEKMRHHNVRLHGWGVVCGLRVRAHDNPACRDRYVVVEPGSALDCCGHEILVAEPELVDVRAAAAVQALERSQDSRLHALGICIRYRECPTEDVPVLYDECGCDETRCAPNRILESFEIDVLVDPPLPKVLPEVAGKASALGLAAKGVSRIVPVSSDGMAYLLDPVEGRQLLVLDLSRARATRVDLPGKGLTLALGDGRVYIVMEAASGMPADDRQLAVYDATAKALLDWGGQLATTIPGSGGMAVELVTTSVASRRLVAVLGGSGQVLAWPDQAAAPGLGAMQTLGTISGGVRGVAVSSDGQRLFAAAPTGSALKAVDLDPWAQQADLAVLPGTATPGALTVASIGTTEALIASDASASELHFVDPGATPTLLGTLALDHPVVAVADAGGGWISVIEQQGERFYLQSIYVAGAAAVGSATVVASREIGDVPALVALRPDGDAGLVDVHGLTSADCADLLWRHLDGCPDCDLPNCVMLATIRRYRPLSRMEDPSPSAPDVNKDLEAGVARIDNRRGRNVLAATSTLQAWIECLLGQEGAGQGPQGPAGPAGPGIDEAIAVSGAPVNAQILADTPTPGKRTLQLTIPPGANGADGKGIDYVTVLPGPPGSTPTAVLQENTPTPGKRTLQLTIPPGPAGKDGVGVQGPPGDGLEAGLTRIAGTSWVHGLDPIPVVPGTFAPLVPVRTREGAMAMGLIVVFTAPIVFVDATHKRPTIDSRHVFQVLAELAVPRDQSPPILACPCPIDGRVVAVGRDDLNTAVDWQAYVAKVIATGPPAAPDPALWQGFVELPLAASANGAWAIAFLITEEVAKQLRGGVQGSQVESLWVKLRGDFVLDTKERAIDAEFVRARFPTGDRPKGAKVGVQGGLFESWLATGWLG